LKGVRGNTEEGICPMCNKEEGWSHILRCVKTRSWREELADKRFTNIEPEIGMRRIATIIDNDKLQQVVGFEVLTAVSMKMAVLWVVAPCSLVEVYQW
jgi:hypothetical protein